MANGFALRVSQALRNSPDGKAALAAAAPVRHTIAGTVAIGAGASRWYNKTGSAKTLGQVTVSAGTAPTGADLILDVNKNGVSVFTNQASRPKVAAGAFVGVVTPPATTIADGDYVSIDVDQVGSTVAGANLIVEVAFV